MNKAQEAMAATAAIAGLSGLNAVIDSMGFGAATRRDMKRAAYLETLRDRPTPIEEFEISHVWLNNGCLVAHFKHKTGRGRTKRRFDSARQFLSFCAEHGIDYSEES